jgi:ABC-type branched-subunit amino acid transport system ATPase component
VAQARRRLVEKQQGRVMDFVMGLADRLVVMNFGAKLCEGPPRVVRTNPAVVARPAGRRRAPPRSCRSRR